MPDNALKCYSIKRLTIPPSGMLVGIIFGSVEKYWGD